MMCNFILCIIAIILAIRSAYEKDTSCCLLDATIALINLPFAIKWLITYLN